MNNIKYSFKENDNDNEYKLSPNDKIGLLVERTGIIYKKVKIVKS